jgi:predicted outer membrane repeat protein
MVCIVPLMQPYHQINHIMAVIVPSNMRWLVPLLMIVIAQAPSSLCQGAQETVIVYTDCSNSSVNADSGNSRCVELDEALSSAVSGTILYLQPGVHTVYNTTIISDLTNLLIVGTSEVSRDQVVITCSQGQGLSFVNISGLFLSHVTISNCGLGGQLLSSKVDILRNYIELFIYFPSATQVAVFLGLCENVSIVNTTITNTIGLGLIGINVLGNSVISGVNFTNNRYPLTGRVLRSRIGGGAYFFYGDLHPNVSDTFSMQKSSVLILNRSRFEFNSDSSSVAQVEANYQYILFGSGVAVYPVGGAGGLTIMLAQRRFPSIVCVISTLFSKNSAAFGGGGHVGIFSGVEHSHVSFQDCIFDSNHVDDRYGSSNGGAGLAVFTGLFNPLQSNLAIATENVSVTISGSSFVGNNATKGGGLFTFSLYNGLTSVIASINSDGTSSGPIISLLNCIFEHNTARYGAGLSFEQRIDHGSNGNVAIEISNVTVAKNALTGQRSSFTNMDSSAMHFEGITVTVSGKLFISDNTATGLYLSAGSMIISSGATVTLSRNTGVLGGGVHLAGRLPIIISMPNSKLLFRENRAALQGGAIYVSSQQVTTVTDVLTPLNDECFFLPITREIKCAPGNLTCYNEVVRDLNIHVSFQGNEAPLGGAVYGSSLETCLWTFPLRVVRDKVAPGLQMLQFLAVSYPGIFDFDQTLDNPSVVSTVPSAISVNAAQAELIPGQQTRLNVSIMDDYNNEIPAVISSLVSSDSDDSSNATSTLGESGYWFTDTDTLNAMFRITGLENTEVNVTFFTTDTFTTKEVVFVLSSCPLGIVYDMSTSSCVCDPRVNTDGVTCDNLTLDINLPNNVWMGTLVGDLATDGDVIIHRCGPGCVDGSKLFNSSDFDTQCKESLGRSGVLCGGCAPSLSATFGSLGCFRCSNYSLFLIPVFILAGIVLFIMVALLGFTIDKGWINIVLFYCNLLSIYGYIISVRYGNTVLFVPAALLSLQIGTNLCFYDGMTALVRTGLQLIFPAYLFALMGVFTLLCRRYSWLSKRFSPTTTLVTLAIMCYVSTLNSCIDILGGITLVTVEGRSSVRWRIDPNQEYSNGYHLFLVHVAVVLLVMYIIPFPIMMLCPTLLYRYVKRFKPFYDALWAPYKRKYRFWLGVRLILLLILFSLPRIFEITFIIPILILYIMQYLQLILRPFTLSSINYVDNFLLLILSIVLLGSVYKELLSSTFASTIISWIEYVLLVLVIVAGYVIITVIFYMQLRIKFAILKRICHGYCIRDPKKSSTTTTVVTHTEVALDDTPSFARVSLDFDPSSDPARLRESLLENNF